jgi:hypothetical protein
MASSFFDWNKTHDGWRGAPWWARRLRDTGALLVLQNEAILAKLEERPPSYPPEDQAKINQIFDTATATAAMADDALPKT